MGLFDKINIFIVHISCFKVFTLNCVFALQVQVNRDNWAEWLNILFREVADADLVKAYHTDCLPWKIGFVVL